MIWLWIAFGLACCGWMLAAMMETQRINKAMDRMFEDKEIGE